MAEDFIINQDLFEKAIQILESRSFLDKKEHKATLIHALCQIEHFRILMRHPQLEHYLFPFIEEFALQVTYKHIPKGRILFFEGESNESIFFVLRGSIAEFRLKSQDNIHQELFWDSEAKRSKEELQQAQVGQLEEQEKQKKQILYLERLKRMSMKKLDEINHKQPTYYRQQVSSLPSPSDSTYQKQNGNQTPLASGYPQSRDSVISKESQLHSRSPSLCKSPSKKKPLLDEAFFTQEYKEKSSKLQLKSELCLDAVKFYAGAEAEELLKIENKHQERHFKKGKCLYKINKTFLAGESFGELKAQGESNGNQTSKNIIVCSQDSFLLIISQKGYQRIFESLTERLNFVFNVLANCFPSAKKLILQDFSYQFEELRLELNDTLYCEGDSPEYVYVMKSGEIDFRKKLNLRGEMQEKRISLIVQGELFGHEDLFNQAHNYTVASCVNNSMIYRIRKQCLFIYQFMASIRQAAKSKSEYLHKKLLELYIKNSEYIPLSNNQTATTQLGSNISLNSLATIENRQPSSQHNIRLPKTQLQKFQNDSLQFTSSISQLAASSGSNSSLSYTSQYFGGIKNQNFGENDFELAFKSLSKIQLLQQSIVNSHVTDEPPSKLLIGDEQQSGLVAKPVPQQFATAGSGMRGKKKGLIQVIKTERAQPESVYSRTIEQEIQEGNQISQKNEITSTSSQSLINNKTNRSQSSTNRPQTAFGEFRLNKMPRDMFALQMQINVDLKLKKQQKNLSIKSGNFTEEENADKKQSLNSYKNQVKDYFQKEANQLVADGQFGANIQLNNGFMTERKGQADYFEEFYCSKKEQIKIEGFKQQLKQNDEIREKEALLEALKNKQIGTKQKSSKFFNNQMGNARSVNPSPLKSLQEKEEEEQNIKFLAIPQNQKVQSYYVNEAPFKLRRGSQPKGKDNQYNNNNNNSSAVSNKEQKKTVRITRFSENQQEAYYNQDCQDIKKPVIINCKNTTFSMRQISGKKEESVNFQTRNDSDFRKAVEIFSPQNNQGRFDKGGFIKINSIALQSEIQENQLRKNLSNIINFDKFRQSNRLQLAPDYSQSISPKK